MNTKQNLKGPFAEERLVEHATKLLRNLVSTRGIHHAILGMEKGDGSFRQVVAVGEASPDGTPMEEDTPYFIASVTKLYIATTVLQLSEHNALDLDAPISNYFPGGSLKGLHVLDGVEYTDQITPRHLLAHASGLPDWLEDRPRGGKSLLETMLHDEDRYYSFEDLLMQVRERLVPLFPPAQFDRKKVRIRYSDTNFQLLIALVERIRNQSIDEIFEESIFRPLKLKQTFFPGSLKDQTQEGPGGSRPAVLWAGDTVFTKIGVLRAVRDLYSTAEDGIVFLRALVRGELFKKPETFRWMTERWNRFGFPTRVADLRLPGYPIEYGLGVMRFELPRLFTPFKRIPPVIGHTGSTGSWLFYCPEFDLYLSGTVDQITAGAVPFRLIARLLHALG